jgi:hypothetical protein
MKITIDDAEEYADRLNERLCKAGWRPGVDFDEWTAEEILNGWNDEEYRELVVSSSEMDGVIYH